MSAWVYNQTSGLIMTVASQWIESFPGLGGLSADIQNELCAHSQIIELGVGDCVFAAGMAPENFILLISGTVRVQQVSEGGREIVLYRVSAGESCALTTACLMGYEDYLAEAIVEEKAKAVAIPRQVFDDLLTRSNEFRQFVFTAFSQRVANLFRIIDEVAFSRIDIRLAHKLVELAKDNPKLERTHQQLASELGSAREVISRQMKEFQRRGWISTTRGSITLLDHDALEHLADTDHPPHL